MAESPYETCDRFRLDDKVCVVTGASHGIGRTIAESFAGAGASLVVNGRDVDALQEVAREIRERAKRPVLVVAGDVADAGFGTRLVHAVLREFGRIDVLVNNAGVNRRGESASYTEEDWDHVVNVDLKGAFFMAQACGNAMIERGEGGKIINILSLASSIGLPGAPAYSAAKGGLLQLTKTLAVEWAPDDIQVNGIGPGFIRTQLNLAIQKDHRSNWVLRRTPARRWGETVELTGAAIFLASPAADFITGQVLYVDGGFLSGSDWRTGD